MCDEIELEGYRRVGRRGRSRDERRRGRVFFTRKSSHILHRITTRRSRSRGSEIVVLAAADLLHHRIDGIAVLHVELRVERGQDGDT